MGCEAWAKNLVSKFLEADPESDAVLIEIAPKGDMPLLGMVFMPEDGKVVRTNWHYHYAVLCDHEMHDQQYPNGISERAYKDRFTNKNEIDFTPIRDWKHGVYLR